MARFEPAFKFLLRDEGGYSNNPRDKGGETYRGISRKYWPQWFGWTLIDGARWKTDFPKILNSNQSLNDSVEIFYRSKYWNPSFNLINSQQVASKLFDEAVNMDPGAGFGWAIKCLQQAICKCGISIDIDEKFGQQTLNALNAIHPDELLKEFCSALRLRYLGIIAEDPSQKVFENDWLKRAAEIPPTA